MNLKSIVVIALAISISLSINAQYTIYPDPIHNLKRPKIGLVLSGGGAKGLAHIGVLKVLEECGIKPDYITGTSMGSIVGGLYALGYSASEIESIVNAADWNILLSDKITWREIGIFHKDEYPGYPLKFIFNKGQKPSLPSGMIEGQQIHALLSKLCWVSNKYSSFDEFPIPYRCVATDIMTGEPIVFKDGNLADAMRASMSIPTVFSPVRKDSLLLTDGGMVRNYPVQECIDMGADIIIGSYTGFDEKAKAEEIRSLISILTRSSVFQGINDAKIQIPKTDVLIVPDLKEYGAESFSKAAQIMMAGEKAARDSLTYQKLQEIGIFDQLLLKKNKVDSLGNIKINQIIISGPPWADIKLIEELCDIYPGDEVNPVILNDAVNKLYATGDYKKVSYQILTGVDKDILVFKCTEKEAGKIEVGLHYNNSFGPAVLARYAMRDFLIPKTLFKAKIAISENPRLQINYDYYPTKRKNVAFFLESYLQANKMPNVARSQDTFVVMGHYRYNHLNYAVGAKWQLWKNIMFEAKAGQNYNAMKLKDGMQYMFQFDNLDYSDFYTELRLRINNLDDPYFPTNGVYLDLGYKWVFDARMNNPIEELYVEGLSERNEICRFAYKQFIRIKNRVSIIPELQFGVMNKKSFLPQEFFIGGHNYQLHPNAINMSGFNANNIIADNFIKAGIGVQARLFKDLYVQYGLEALAFVDFQEVYSDMEMIEGELFSAWHAGVGTRTPIGPVRLICSGSYEREGVFWSLNIGIPF